MAFFGEDLKKMGAFYNSLKVVPQYAPNMTVKVTPGSFWYNYKTFVDFPGATTAVISAPTANNSAKIVIVAINRVAVLQLVDGIADSNPKIPELPAGLLPLAFVLVRSGQTMITEENIFDARAIFQNPAFVVPHNNLEGRNEVNAHPISSITGLTEELQNKLSVNLLNSFLVTKADVDGTNSKTFTVNKGTSGVPTDDVFIKVERGSLEDATIQWDESNDRWVFSDDLAVKDAATGRITGFVLQDYEGTSTDVFRLVVKSTGEVGVMNVTDVNKTVTFLQNDGKVKVDDTDASPDYLENKIEASTMEIVAGKISAKTQVEHDVEITDFNKGVILTSPDGSRFRLTVNNDGTINSSKISEVEGGNGDPSDDTIVHKA